MKTYVQSLISLFFPRLCESCDGNLLHGEEVICMHCLRDLPTVDYHLKSPNPIIQDLSNGHLIDNAYSFLKYQKKGIAQKLIHGFKYKGKRDIGEFLAVLVSRGVDLLVDQHHIEYIIPVPIQPYKKWKRGYNQTEVLAEVIAEKHDLSVIGDSIKRKTSGKIKSQAKKSRMSRWGTIENQYYLARSPEEIRGKSIIILDDVITTGATISVMVSLLQSFSPAKIIVVCVATGKTINYK